MHTAPKQTAQFTSGLWTSRRAASPIDGAYDFGIGASINGKDFCIAEAFARVATDVFPNAEANAKLIAAAPDLFYALKNMVECFGSEDGCNQDIFLEQARQALSKVGA